MVVDEEVVGMVEKEEKKAMVDEEVEAEMVEEEKAEARMWQPEQEVVGGSWAAYSRVSTSRYFRSSVATRWDSGAWKGRGSAAASTSRKSTVSASWAVGRSARSGRRSGGQQRGPSGRGTRTCVGKAHCTRPASRAEKKRDHSSSCP